MKAWDDNSGTRERLTPWEKKAHQIIGKYCRESYLQANTPNRATRKLLKGDRTIRLCKRHIPYHVPAIADALVKALGIHDPGEREREIKRLFEVERLGAWTLIASVMS